MEKKLFIFVLIALTYTSTKLFFNPRLYQVAISYNTTQPPMFCRFLSAYLS